MGQLSYGAYLAEITEDCWRRAGLITGMRVLNPGCGSGESAFLASRLVGPTGFVVGLESDPQRLKLARRAADERSIENIEFRDGNTDLQGEAPFDGIVGRHFLVGQEDPVAALRQLARLIRPGGIMVFLEEELDYGHRMEPQVALANQAMGWIQAADRDLGRQLHLVSSFPRIFLEAGLGWPMVRAYQSAWGAGASADLWQYVADMVRERLPVIERVTRRGRDEIGADTLRERLEDAVKECAATWTSPPTAGAWTRLPPL